MPKYLVQANYVGDGLKGLLKEGGSSRRDAIDKLFESVGARWRRSTTPSATPTSSSSRMRPTTVSAAALSLAVNASGAVAAEVTVLLTAEEVDAAVKKTPGYRAPSVT